MLRNCHEVFNLQSMSRKFLDTLEEVITSPRSSPVVRGRMLEFLAAAAYDQRMSAFLRTPCVGIVQHPTRRIPR